MSNEEDRDVRSMAERTADERFPEMALAPENEQRAEDFAEGYVAGYRSPVHRTPAPAADVQALIDEAQVWTADPQPARGDVMPADEAVSLIRRLANALEAALAVSTPQDITDDMVERAAVAVGAADLPNWSWDETVRSGVAVEYRKLARAALEATLGARE